MLLPTMNLSVCSTVSPGSYIQDILTNERKVFDPLSHSNNGCRNRQEVRMWHIYKQTAGKVNELPIYSMW